MGRITARGVLAALLVVVVAGVCVRLGFWQLDRLQQRRARNAALEGALSLPVLELRGDSLAAVFRDPERYVNRRVRVRGVYDPAGEVVLRGRTSEGRPGVHLVSPLRVLGGDTAILVNRGWVPSPDAVTVDPRRYAESGERSLEGILQVVPTPADGGTPLHKEVGGDTVRTYRRLDLHRLRAASPYRLLPVYIQQLPTPEDPAQSPRRVPPPALDEGSHLSYAIQWFSFATIAVVGFAVAILSRRRRA